MYLLLDPARVAINYFYINRKERTSYVECQEMLSRDHAIGLR